jgi:hypothetical protein
MLRSVLLNRAFRLTHLIGKLGQLLLKPVMGSLHRLKFFLALRVALCVVAITRNTLDRSSFAKLTLPLRTAAARAVSCRWVGVAAFGSVVAMTWWITVES